MKTKLISVILVITLFLSMTLHVSANQTISVYMNNEIALFSINGTTDVMNAIKVETTAAEEITLAEGETTTEKAED